MNSASGLKKGFLTKRADAPEKNKTDPFVAAAHAALPGGAEGPHVRRRAPPNPENLVAAAAMGDMQRLEYFLTQGVAPSAAVRSFKLLQAPYVASLTPLTAAVMGGHVDVVRRLCAAGAKLRQPAYLKQDGKPTRWPPVCLALKQASACVLPAEVMASREVARLLIEQGPRGVNDKDPCGNTPLHLATALGDPLLVLPLLNAGANLRACNAKGDTPLHLAARLGWEGAVVTYAQKTDCYAGTHLAGRFTEGPDPFAVNRAGQSALHAAVLGGNPGVVRALLKGGAPASLCDLQGRTAERLAIELLADATEEQVNNLDEIATMLRPGPIAALRERTASIFRGLI